MDPSCKKVLPEAACITTCKNLNPTTTLGGTVQLNQTVSLEQLCSPKFNKNIKVEGHEMIMFNSNCCYDVNLGGDFLQTAGININYTECQIKWLDWQLPLRNAHEFHKEDKIFLVDSLYAQEEEKWFGDDFMELLATTIY